MKKSIIVVLAFMLLGFTVKAQHIRISNQQNLDQYLNIESGSVFVSEINLDWTSATWKFVPLKADAPSVVRILNIWKNTVLDYVDGSLVCNPKDDDAFSQIWQIVESENPGFFRIKNKDVSKFLMVNKEGELDLNNVAMFGNSFWKLTKTNSSSVSSNKQNNNDPIVDNNTVKHEINKEIANDIINNQQINNNNIANNNGAKQEIKKEIPSNNKSNEEIKKEIANNNISNQEIKKEIPNNNKGNQEIKKEVVNPIVSNPVNNTVQKIDIYTMPGCGNCAYAKKYMTQNNIAFTEHDTKDPAVNSEMFRVLSKSGKFKGGSFGMPVIVVNGEVNVSIPNLSQFLIDLKNNQNTNNQQTNVNNNAVVNSNAGNQEIKKEVVNPIVSNPVNNTVQKIDIYTMPGCGNCAYAKKYMTQNNIAFTEHDTKDPAVNSEMFRVLSKSGKFKGGSFGMPVIVVNGEVNVSIPNLSQFLIDLKNNQNTNNQQTNVNNNAVVNSNAGNQEIKKEVVNPIVSNPVNNTVQKIDIYTMPGCGNCAYAKKYMTQNNIAFTEHDTKDPAVNSEMFRVLSKSGKFKGGSIGMPVIVVNGEVNVNIPNLSAFLANLSKN